VTNTHILYQHILKILVICSNPSTSSGQTYIFKILHGSNCTRSIMYCHQWCWFWCHWTPAFW